MSMIKTMYYNKTELTNFVAMFNSENTAQTYGRVIEVFFREHGDRGEAWIRDALKEFINAPKAYQTKNVRLAALRKYFKRVDKDIYFDLLDVNLGKMVVKQVELGFNEKQARAIMQKSRYSGALSFMFLTGLRISECLKVKFSDIENGHGHFSVIGKGQIERKVYLASYQKILARIRAEQGLNASHEYLFEMPQGAGVVYQYKSGDDRAFKQNVRRRQFWGRIVKEEFSNFGITCSPHKLRDLHIISLLENGCTIEEVSNTMRHSSTDITQRYSNKRDLSEYTGNKLRRVL